MSRRIDVELTSARSDGTWTWRAAGARQPKGELDGGLLYPGAKVGDVVRADADFAIDGISIVAVLPPKGARSEPARIEILGPPRRDEPGVTTVLASRGRRDRRDRGDRPDRGERGDRPGRGDRRDRGDRPREGRARREGGDRREARPRPARPARPAPEPRPRAKRLRAGRAHRNAILTALPDTHRPIAEELVRGGIPAVRQTLDRQNAALVADKKPPINPEPLLDIAERLMPLLRTAEWRDKAEAALADAAEIDLRDLRSVVVAADASARDDETRALAEELRTALGTRVDREHQAWLDELTQNLDDGRVVRALRLSSRPPKAGAPLPTDLAKRLTEAAGTSLTAEISDERYGTVLEALALSPVRRKVVPTHVPEKPSDELLVAVRKVAARVPEIAARFGLEASAPRRGGSRRGRGEGGGPPAPVPAPPTEAAVPAVEAAEPAAAPANAAPAVEASEPTADPSEAAKPTAAPAEVAEPAAAPAEVAEPTAAPSDAAEPTAAPAEVAPAPAEASGTDAG
jgi:hypothetical protein